MIFNDDILSPGAETGGVDFCILRFEAIETPEECQFQVAAHVVDRHMVILSGMVDCHCP